MSETAETYATAAVPKYGYSSTGKPIVALDPDLGPMAEKPEMVHFSGGPWCGLDCATRMAEAVIVRIDSGPCAGRWHYYARTKRVSRSGVPVVQHEMIDDENRRQWRPRSA